MCCLFLLDIFYKCSPVLSKLSCSVLFLASRLRDFDLKEATRLGRRPSSGTVSPILLIKIFNIRWKGFFLSPENLMDMLSSSSYESGFGKGLHSTSTEIIVRQEPPTQTQTSIYRETLNSAKSWRVSLIPKRKIFFVVFVEIELCEPAAAWWQLEPFGDCGKAELLQMLPHRGQKRFAKEYFTK